MSAIIKPPRTIRSPDPYIAPVHGTYGPCALCRHYSKLTENHVPPESTGNADRWLAQSYLTTVTGDSDLIFGRRFNGGIRFRTLCADCNNKLGGREDKALLAFNEQVTKLVESPFQLPPLMRIAAKPNLIIRGLLAHSVSANDTGVPSRFDEEARSIFFGKKAMRLSSWNVFYWIYMAKELFLARSLFLASWFPTLVVHEMQILKIYPLAFLFTDAPHFYGLPNMMQFIRPRDEDEAELPLFLYRRENNPVFPAYAGSDKVVFAGGHAFGLVARQD